MGLLGTSREAACGVWKHGALALAEPVAGKLDPLTTDVLATPEGLPTPPPITLIPPAARA